MSEFPLPRAHEGPRRNRFAAGRTENGRVVTFPASTPIRHDESPEPDTLPSDRIEPGWGNGILDGFTAKLPEPTPPGMYDDAIVASILEKMAETHAKLAVTCRKLAATMRPRGGRMTAYCEHGERVHAFGRPPSRRRQLEAELARCEERLDAPSPLPRREAKKLMDEIARIEGELEWLDQQGDA